MLFSQIIEKKKHQIELSEVEINELISAYLKDEIKDYQMSAFLMAVYFNGMSEKETFYLTQAMIDSGSSLDLSSLSGVVCDKHSSGGVGDKTSLVLLPMVSACGVLIAKMSGRGLGFSGGTIDKLESIPGFQVEISQRDFLKQVQDIGLAIVSQSENLVLADKKLYALRDVSGSVDSIPLIASSIMSKKIASGAKGILLDVKYGEGAFMKSINDATKLAKLMIKIGSYFNRDVSVMITNMNQPLGYAIGNGLEVMEAINALKGNGPVDLMQLCYEAGSLMLMQAKIVDNKQAGLEMLQEVIKQGKAINQLKNMIEAQHGDTSCIDNPKCLIEGINSLEIKAHKSGYLKQIHSERIAFCLNELGGGRKNKTDVIDSKVGFVLKAKVADRIEKDMVLVEVYYRNQISNELLDKITSCFVIDDVKPQQEAIIQKIIWENDDE